MHAFHCPYYKHFNQWCILYTHQVYRLLPIQKNPCILKCILHSRLVYKTTAFHPTRAQTVPITVLCPNCPHHCSASPCITPHCRLVSHAPPCPGLPQGLGFLRVHSHDAASLEATLQQQHALAPDAVKGLTGNCPGRLLWVHTSLQWGRATRGATLSRTVMAVTKGKKKRTSYPLETKQIVLGTIYNDATYYV